MEATAKPAPTPPAFSVEAIGTFLLTWTPRALAAGIGGYYSLGLAYEYGVMASIDQVAIMIIKEWTGTVGIGAMMPTFQWYSAMGVRLVAAAMCGVIYDLIERICLYIYSACFSEPAPQTLPAGTPITVIV